MNPEMPQKPQDESEARLTALLLGELPHEQAAALHQKLAQDAELAKLYERLKHTINLVRESLATPAAQTSDQPTPLKLSADRREKLLQHFKTVAPIEFIPIRRRAMPWLVPVGIAAALVVIAGSLAMPRFANRTKSMGAWGWGDTHAASDEQYAKLRSLAPARGGRSEDLRNLNRREDQLALGVQQSGAGTTIRQSLMQAVPSAKPAATQKGEPALRLRFANPPSQIILPESSQLADGTTTPASAEGAQPGFTVAGTTRGFYDDSLGRAGGMGGGGGFGGGGMGGSGGRLRGEASAAEGQQVGPAAAVEGERIQALGESPPPPVVVYNSDQTLEYKADGIVPTVGPDGEPLLPAPQSQPFVYRNAYIVPPEAAKGTGTGTGASSAARQYQNGITAGDSFLSADAETRRIANVEAPPPAAIPALSASLAPAQAAPGQAVASQSAPGPAPVPAEPGSLERGLVLSGVLVHAPGNDKPAGDLTANLRAAVPGRPAPDVSDAGELLLKRNLAGLDSANKPADAAVAAERIAEANPSFSFYIDANRNPAPATPPVGSRPAQEVELKQALAGESPPPASGSYYGGGAFGGYSSIQKLPSGGDQGVAPSGPALRSPKEGGFAGGVGNAALPPAPSGPQDAAVNGTVLSQANRTASNQSDQRALGFDWHLGNSLARNGRLAAQGGTAPSEAGQALVQGRKPEQSSTQSEPAPAFKGTLSGLPVLGDVPAAGRLFQPKAAEGDNRANDQIAAGAMQLQVEEKVKSVDLGLKEDLQRQTNAVTLESVSSFELANANPQDVNASLQELFKREAAVRGAQSADEVNRAKASPIVLPTPQGETGLALKDGGGKGVQLFASANQTGPASATLEDTRKQAAEDTAKTQPYFEAKRQLEELQRFRQTLDAKIASEKIDVELPKTMMVEIVDRAVPPSSPSSTLWEKVRGKAGDFKSIARIKVERDQSDIAGLADAQKVTGYNPYFVQTEFETIQSEAILGKVIKDLNLNEAWGKKQGGRTLTTAETMALLKNKLDLRPEQNTSLIDIGVKGDQPEEAVKIANAVAEEYRSHRAEQRAQLSKAGIKAMEERFAEQEQKVREAQKKVDALRVELKIPDAAASGKSTLTLVPTDMAALKPAAPAPIPQPEVQTTDNAFSTFSLNVSDV